MERRVFPLLLLAILFVTSPGLAACKTCNPGCQNAATGASGWTQCFSNSGACDLSGVTCTGSGGSDGGSCDPDTLVCDLGFLNHRPGLMLASFRTTNGGEHPWELVDVAIRTAEASPKLTMIVR
jgi:hypothetical protein